FFFSSRRRHTSSDRDWSSDVCSSDLVERGPDQDPASARGLRFPPDARRLHAVGPYWIDENEQPLTMKTHVVPSSSAWASKAYVEIGRASCRERVEIWGDALSLQEHDR